jgi:outer membrane protein, multidrug efflux system
VPRIRPTLPLLAALALAAGCTVGPSYHAPKAAAPAAFGEVRPAAPGADGIPTAAPADPEVLARWWTVLRDPELDSLIDRALRNNRDLKTAVSRVREARAERQVAAGALLPEVNADAGYNRSLGSRNVVLPLGALAGSSSSAGGSGSGGSGSKGASTAGKPRSQAEAGSPLASPTAGAEQGVQPGGPASPFGEGGLPGVTTNLYQAGFDAVWEVDVFGGTRRAVEAANAETAAAQEGEYGVQVTLMAEVATTYLQLRENQERAEVARRNIESERQTWRIARDKFQQGLGEEVEAAQDLAQLKVAETALPPLASAERTAEHALAFLLGLEPTALAAELGTPRPFPALPPEVPVGVPSDVLRRRPDVRQAERQLAAASADVGVATAQLYPQFSLTGSAGLDSSTLRQLPEWSSRYFSIAPGVNWPILDWARLHAAIRVQDELQAQALLAYETAVSQALRDVEDALVQFQSERDRRQGLVAAVAEARHAQQVTAEIYSEGLADQTASLLAERAVFQAEDSLAQSEGALRVDLVSLYKALGGGWQVDR